ncbi:MAG: hypothetical protein RL693_453 [Verrucomicrobiota bacterium]
MESRRSNGAHFPVNPVTLSKIRSFLNLLFIFFLIVWCLLSLLGPFLAKWLIVLHCAFLLWL